MKKIVVIEDDITLRENTLTFLKEEGFEAYAEEDGFLGITLTKNVLPDLVLCDIGLPKMSGYDTCIAIKKDENLSDIPVIFLTAYGSNESIIKGFEAGAQDYITKPFNYDELLARVNTHIELKQKKEELKQVNHWLELKVKERTIELETANKKLAFANGELLNFDLVKTNFLKIISSEIRKPLERIKEPIELLKHKIENKNLVELIEIIDDSVTRLEKFSIQALEITQIKAGLEMINKAEISLISVIENAFLSVQKQITEKKIKIKSDIKKNLKIYGNCDLLVKCFANILDNACKYSKKNSVIEVIAISQTHYFNIEIKDHGQGMSVNIISNLFKMFTPGEKQVDQNTGMGLYHSKLITESHGGIIQINSKENKGTTVTFTFPNAYNE